MNVKNLAIIAISAFAHPKQSSIPEILHVAGSKSVTDSVGQILQSKGMAENLPTIVQNTGNIIQDPLVNRAGRVLTAGTLIAIGNHINRGLNENAPTSPERQTEAEPSRARQRGLVRNAKVGKEQKDSVAEPVQHEQKEEHKTTNPTVTEPEATKSNLATPSSLPVPTSYGNQHGAGSQSVSGAKSRVVPTSVLIGLLLAYCN